MPSVPSNSSPSNRPPMPPAQSRFDWSGSNEIADGDAQEVVVLPGGGLSKPIVLSDVASNRLSRQAPWHSPALSTSSSDSSEWPSPSSSPPSSVPMTPSSSASSASSSSSSFWPSTSLASPISEEDPPTPSTSHSIHQEFPFPSSPLEKSRPLPPTPKQSLPPLPVSEVEPWWEADDFSLKLVFTSPSSQQDADDFDNDSDSLPPAFFPASRIHFAPRLQVHSPKGVPFDAFGGLHLGVTGMLETFDRNGQVRSKRMLADFCTDLTSGLGQWKRDGMATKRSRKGTPLDDGILPSGNYILPLSMKIPTSDRLPPSIECSRYRISYTMSVALFSSAYTSNGLPRRLKIYSTPFHMLPSTLPSPSPELPVLTHENKGGLMASLMRSLPFTTKTETAYHIVYPSLPTSHYSPASHATIPVSLRIVDRPLEPTDLYFRISLIRKIYVRESTRVNLSQAIEDELGLGPGITPQALGYPEDQVIEPWCKEEEEICSRWGWVPYSSRPGADPMERAEVVIKDIGLPLSGLNGQGWEWGYSGSHDIEPTDLPEMKHGLASWFSSAFRSRPPVEEEYKRHIHVSSRFYLLVEIGFATPALEETLQAIGASSPDMQIPLPKSFTPPQIPSTSRFSGASLSNPFPSSSRRSSPSSSTTSPFTATPAFPGKMRELVIPVNIGSVAEPNMECIQPERESHQQRMERREREERGEDMRFQGQGSEGAWLCAPPVYEDALRSVPAYIWA